MRKTILYSITLFLITYIPQNLLAVDCRTWETRVIDNIKYGRYVCANYGERSFTDMYYFQNGRWKLYQDYRVFHNTLDKTDIEKKLWPWGYSYVSNCGRPEKKSLILGNANITENKFMISEKWMKDEPCEVSPPRIVGGTESIVGGGDETESIVGGGDETESIVGGGKTDTGDNLICDYTFGDKIETKIISKDNSNEDYSSYILQPVNSNYNKGNEFELKDKFFNVDFEEFQTGEVIIFNFPDEIYPSEDEDCLYGSEFEKIEQSGEKTSLVGITAPTQTVISCEKTNEILQFFSFSKNQNGEIIVKYNDLSPQEAKEKFLEIQECYNQETASSGNISIESNNDTYNISYKYYRNAYNAISYTDEDFQAQYTLSSDENMVVTKLTKNEFIELLKNKYSPRVIKRATIELYRNIFVNDDFFNMSVQTINGEKIYKISIVNIITGEDDSSNDISNSQSPIVRGLRLKDPNLPDKIISATTSE